MIDTIPKTSFEPVLIALLVLTSLVVILQLVFTAIIRKPFSGEDIWLLLCYVFSFTCGLIYIDLLKVYFRTIDLAGGPYPDTEGDAVLMQKWIFTSTILYWSCLWSAKLSFLCFYKKLFVQLPVYVRLWWSLVGVCILHGGLVQGKGMHDTP
ncbi:unnamed protein product [Clonostachys rhizophaga]|uniref:Uncharacterized protein n=1 Tax=Clonostachys rhizophaga TaxID=160324 RepID=A0A9N9W345_9HYPO|nr:unnamed protein product [Clonostachys rhizophaga]